MFTLWLPGRFREKAQQSMSTHYWDRPLHALSSLITTTALLNIIIVFCMSDCNSKRLSKLSQATRFAKWQKLGLQPKSCVIFTALCSLRWDNHVVVLWRVWKVILMTGELVGILTYMCLESGAGGEGSREKWRGLRANPWAPKSSAVSILKVPDLFIYCLLSKYLLSPTNSQALCQEVGMQRGTGRMSSWQSQGSQRIREELERFGV